MAVTTYYCTWKDVSDRIGAAGVDFRVDDDPSTKTDVLYSATVEVNGYLLLLYTAAALAQSDWVKVKTRDIACFLLCLRRNHPPPKSVVDRYLKAIADLEKIQSGSVRLPDTAESKANVPVLSNQRVRLDPVPHPVTVEGTSTGKAEGYVQHVDSIDNIDYSL